MSVSTKEQLKARSKHLAELLQEKYKLKVSHGDCLNLVSRLFGFKDWNTASALAAKAGESLVVSGLASEVILEKPIATKFQTTGELMDFLSKFDRGTKLVVNEYSWAEPNSNNPLAGNITSVCSLTYDYEIQKETELILELNTEIERNDTAIGGSRSSRQTFERTEAGRSQRCIKYQNTLSGFWNSGSNAGRSERKP